MMMLSDEIVFVAPPQGWVVNTQFISSQMPPHSLLFTTGKGTFWVESRWPSLSTLPKPLPLIINEASSINRMPWPIKSFCVISEGKAGSFAIVY